MSFVLDNSVAMTWCFEDEATPSTDALLKELVSSGAVVPVFWPLEAANVLLMAERKKRINLSDRKGKIDFLSQLPITPDFHSYDIAWEAVSELAARYHLTSYDAAYLELALRRDLPLATLDRDLRVAARKAKVEVLG